MKDIIHMSDLSYMIRRINKRGHEFGFSVYLVITEKYIQVFRNDGELIIQHYSHDEVNIEKVHDKLYRLYLELDQALDGNTKLHSRYKMKYFIYFNY